MSNVILGFNPLPRIYKLRVISRTYIKARGIIDSSRLAAETVFDSWFVVFARLFSRPDSNDCFERPIFYFAAPHTPAKDAVS